MDSESLNIDDPTLRALRMRSVVVTPGARGAPMSKGIDSLAAELAAGDSLLEAPHQAVRSGAFGVQSAGTQPSYPTISDVLPEIAPEGVSTTTGVTA
jgi:ribokinase